jgi:serine protease
MASTAQAEPPFKPGQVVVKGDAWLFSDYEVIRYLPNAGLTIIKAVPGKERGQVTALRNKGHGASLNYIVSKFAPNDSFYSYQWHLPKINTEQAWATTTGNGVNVAVLDTGFHVGGADGVGCLLSGLNTLDGTANTADGDGHGTHVSGTIAQSTNNATGVAGVAPGACILPVKVLDDSGSGTDADIAEGIAWAVNQGARVINMSLGYPAGYPLDTFVNYPSYAQLNALPDDVTVVVASGNDGASGGVSYPANHPNVIAVGATDAVNGIAPYSNKGPELDLVAPGGNTAVDANGDGYGDGVLQETRLDTDSSPVSSNYQWGYYFFQGTSMAAPHVAGAAALLLANDSTLTRTEVLAKLANSAVDLGDAGLDETYGYGLIQIDKAFAANKTIDSGSGGPVEPNPPAKPEGLEASNNADGTATLVWSAATGADSYKIKRAKVNTRKNTIGSFEVVAVQAASVLEYTDASGKGTFEYVVTAVNSDGEVDSDSVRVEVTSGTSTKGGGNGGGGRKNR